LCRVSVWNKRVEASVCGFLEKSVKQAV